MTDKTLLDGFGEATEQVVALRAENERLRAELALMHDKWDESVRDAAASLASERTSDKAD